MKYLPAVLNKFVFTDGKTLKQVPEVYNRTDVLRSQGGFVIFFEETTAERRVLNHDHRGSFTEKSRTFSGQQTGYSPVPAPRWERLTKYIYLETV